MKWKRNERQKDGNTWNLVRINYEKKHSSGAGNHDDDGSFLLALVDTHKQCCNLISCHLSRSSTNFAWLILSLAEPNLNCKSSLLHTHTHTHATRRRMSWWVRRNFFLKISKQQQQPTTVEMNKQNTKSNPKLLASCWCICLSWPIPNGLWLSPTLIH